MCPDVSAEVALWSWTTSAALTQSAHTCPATVGRIRYQFRDRESDLQQTDSLCNDSIKARYIQLQGKRRQMLLPHCAHTSTGIRRSTFLTVAACVLAPSPCVCSALDGPESQAMLAASTRSRGCLPSSASNVSNQLCQTLAAD